MKKQINSGSNAMSGEGIEEGSKWLVEKLSNQSKK